MIKSITNIFKNNQKDKITNIECDVEYVPQNTFKLFHDNNHIGTLRYDKNLWYFNYSQWFKKQNHIKPLFEFPRVDYVYESKSLWPFFKSRIPSAKQKKVKEFVQSHPEYANNLVVLLKKFGQKSINNPFYLVMS